MIWTPSKQHKDLQSHHMLELIFEIFVCLDFWIIICNTQKQVFLGPRLGFYVQNTREEEEVNRTTSLSEQ